MNNKEKSILEIDLSFSEIPWNEVDFNNGWTWGNGLDDLDDNQYALYFYPSDFDKPIQRYIFPEKLNSIIHERKNHNFK
jgi:hypothetical protein